MASTTGLKCGQIDIVSIEIENLVLIQAEHLIRLYMFFQCSTKLLRHPFFMLPLESAIYAHKSKNDKISSQQRIQLSAALQVLVLKFSCVYCAFCVLIQETFALNIMLATTAS